MVKLSSSLLSLTSFILTPSFILRSAVSFYLCKQDESLAIQETITKLTQYGEGTAIFNTSLNARYDLKCALDSSSIKGMHSSKNLEMPCNVRQLPLPNLSHFFFN